MKLEKTVEKRVKVDATFIVHRDAVNDCFYIRIDGLCYKEDGETVKFNSYRLAEQEINNMQYKLVTEITEVELNWFEKRSRYYCNNLNHYTIQQKELIYDAIRTGEINKNDVPSFALYEVCNVMINKLRPTGKRAKVTVKEMAEVFENLGYIVVLDNQTIIIKHNNVNMFYFTRENPGVGYSATIHNRSPYNFFTINELIKHNARRSISPYDKDKHFNNDGQSRKFVKKVYELWTVKKEAINKEINDAQELVNKLREKRDNIKEKYEKLRKDYLY